MGRTRDLSLVLWSALAAACGSDATHHLVDGGAGSADAPKHVDAVAGSDAPIHGDGAPGIDATHDATRDATPDATPDAAQVAVASLADALDLTAECGQTTPGTVDLAISNTGTAELQITAASADSGFTVTSALPITIAVGAQAAVSVRPPAAVVGTDLAGATKTGTLSLTTNEAGTPTHTVALTSTIQGANLAYTDAGGTAITSLSFVAAAATCPAPQPVFIRNTGNEAAQVGTSAGSHFALSGFTSGSVSSSATIQQDVRPFTNSFCMDTQQITYVATGPVCTTATVHLTASYNVNGVSGCFCS